jgi:hypothetical protein
VSTILELTKREQEIFDEVREKIEETAIFLDDLSHEERLDWLKEHQYSRPISFEREISGTLYTVNAHFSESATETTEGKVKRILAQNITR